MATLSNTRYNKGGNSIMYAFAGFPSAKIYDSSNGSKWINHLLFGDYVQILDTEITNNRVKAKSRNTTGWIKITEIQKERVLEINFVDIGQGDGCHVVTPDDKHIIIDAGETDNMNRYLNWRFNLYTKKNPLPFPFTVVISHSDKDHYYGFSYMFDNDKIPVDKIYHNGLVERPGKLPLGDVEDGHITGLVKNTKQMKEIIGKAENRKGSGSMYCNTLYKALKYNPAVMFYSLSNLDNYLNNFDNTCTIENKPFAIKVLGPVITKTNGKDSLKTIKSLGKDKNGHSVLLKIEYDKVKILLGGDVNTEFGEILNNHYHNQGQFNELEVDVAKACHHGSNHFHYGFIKSINAAATVISSGDEEPYAHPRPDAIGALGKCGYGEKPLIFSTELARSNKEFTKSSLQNLHTLMDKLNQTEIDLQAETNEEKISKLKAKKLKINKEINSHLTKYGMINLRTDGQRMIMAQKYEVEAHSGKWDIHELVYSDKTERFELQ